MKTILLIALMQLGPESPGGRNPEHKTTPIARPMPPAAAPADEAAGGAWTMHGGCDHLLSRGPVDLSVEDTPDGAVLRFRARDPRVAQQAARQASACLSGGNGKDHGSEADDAQGDRKRGTKDKHHGHDEHKDD